jgi:hypothetical protein
MVIITVSVSASLMLGSADVTPLAVKQDSTAAALASGLGQLT